MPQPDIDEIFAEVGRIYRADNLTQLDLEKLDQAKAAINQYTLAVLTEALGEIGNQPMPRIGKSGKYIKSPQSFQDGFEEARIEALNKANQKLGGSE